MKKQTTDDLILLLQKLESHLTQRDQRNESVSKSDVAWQIDHSLKVINKVSEVVLTSDPKAYISHFNKWRFLLFNLNYIPRGKARAPKIVQPPEKISNKSLLSQLDLAHQNIDKLKNVQSNAHFKHMIFGVLNKKRTLKFLHLHTKHHLKIIRDIIK